MPDYEFFGLKIVAQPNHTGAAALREIVPLVLRRTFDEQVADLNKLRSAEALMNLGTHEGYEWLIALSTLPHYLRIEIEPCVWAGHRRKMTVPEALLIEVAMQRQADRYAIQQLEISPSYIGSPPGHFSETVRKNQAAGRHWATGLT